MSVEWTEAKGEVLDIVRQMVNAYHPNLQMAKIGVVFRSETSTSGGYEVWAKTAKADAKTNALLEGAGADTIDFLIWIAEPAWKNFRQISARRWWTMNYAIAAVSKAIGRSAGMISRSSPRSLSAGAFGTQLYSGRRRHSRKPYSSTWGWI